MIAHGMSELLWVFATAFVAGFAWHLGFGILRKIGTPKNFTVLAGPNVERLRETLRAIGKEEK